MPIIDGKYYTDEEIESIRKKATDEEFNEFLVSGIIGGLSGSALLGWAVGGDLVGGVLGSLIFGDDDGDTFF